MPILSLLIVIALQSQTIAQVFFNELLAQENITNNVIATDVQVAGVEEILTAEPERVYTTKSIGVVLSAQSSFVLDSETDYVLWEQNSNQAAPIASITKLASIATLLDRDLNLQSIITMSADDLRPAGGNRHIYLGEKIKATDLLHAVLIASDNEALMALVHSTGLSDEEFVVAVNQWAIDHNLVTFHMSEPTGLSSGNIASAQDVAKLAKIVFANTIVSDIAKKTKYSFQTVNTQRQVNLTNTNKLLTSLFDVKFGKTGFIDEAGYCLVTESSLDNGRDVITVVLGADSLTSRFQDTKALLYWVGENYRWSIN